METLKRFNNLHQRPHIVVHCRNKMEPLFRTLKGRWGEHEETYGRPSHLRRLGGSAMSTLPSPG